MRKPIAKIRISAGNPGWYDSLTNIHLTISRPEAFVFEGHNVKNIKNAVAHKLVNVIEGELEPTIIEEVVEIQEPVIEEKQEVREVIVEEIKEVVTEEIVEEKKPAKKTTRKSTKKKAE